MATNCLKVAQEILQACFKMWCSCATHLLRYISKVVTAMNGYVTLNFQVTKKTAPMRGCKGAVVILIRSIYSVYLSQTHT